ncbi:SAM-dependent methyltransferase [Tenacibaculum sp. Bg11-29]|uniref:tRNA (5-methylaminomethyl-2-thiouridine)(34)-methyltransferase MnmD n=1 Tax=Tenacibaculum sp. Bg11-29 TaxID=2058306 RepID=UPI000C346FCF|nr:tRNA (5-methylaminomethyl-2-thiouridine)(34)-methyltransferase MnmD [Tenacibaculum sp. Bg11-29]PKH50574.1 SAM-dependent methyltransferase [Tenacibaculum sp. Bg11-29]
MKREIIITSDGSTTIHLPDWNEQYHSKHGAIQEAYHVFIKNGLELQKKEEISILEIGFGTGLNCFITFLESNKIINYVGVEAYPVVAEEVLKLNYVTELKAENEQAVFNKMHALSWEEKHEITQNFSLTKRQQFFKDINDKEQFDLIYFDAFGAEHQPDLWTEEVFKRMFEALKENGILVTYSAKGSVRRAMQAVGFTVERLPGPPGKREMLRATKLA